MIILSMVLTFVSASVIMYVKTNEWMEQDVRNEAQYVRLLLEQTTDSGWEEQAGTFTTSRITILNEDGTVQYDSGRFRRARKDRPVCIVRLAKLFAYAQHPAIACRARRHAQAPTSLLPGAQRYANLA